MIPACLFAAGLLVFCAEFANAIVEEAPIHASGDREVWNRKTNRVELFGHAAVRQPGEIITADYIVLDQNARTLDAVGNCIYVAADSVIYGEEMHFNLDTRTGTIVGGRVSNDRFTLGGERINKLGDGRFQTHWGEYSTCRDCTQSWSIQAQDVDMQIEGYAHMHNVALKIKDAPTLWLPYLILPMKTQRQSGILPMTLSWTQADGLKILVPVFWAINRSSDMTFGFGNYSERGLRLEWEGRYALSDRSRGTFNLYVQNDRKFADNTTPNYDPRVNPSGNPTRWALDVSQTQELPFSIEQKLRLTEVSDDLYPNFLNEKNEIPGKGEMFLSSTLSFSHVSSDISAYVAGRRIRNLINLDFDSSNGTRFFDPKTVQLYPTAVVTTNDQLLFGLPVAAGVTLGLSNFTRSAGPVDQDAFSTDPAIILGQDPLREATRLSLIPSLYTSFRPFDIFTLTPSLKYYSYIYTFPQESGIAVNNWYRSYALLQADLSFQLERTYDLDDPNRPRRKHLIRPMLTYSAIPNEFIHSDDHPFAQQIEYARQKNAVGYYFDNNDIIPLEVAPNSSTNYFIPLGSSLQYGLVTQLIDRVGKIDSPDATYATPLEFSVGQAINFRDQQQPLTRLFSNLSLNLNDQILSRTTYYYYPYFNVKHEISTGLTFVIERALHHRVLTFDRSVYLNYAYAKEGQTSNLAGGVNFSLSDYLLPSLGASYDLVSSRFLDMAIKLAIQSPSRCWKLALSNTYSVTNGIGWGVDLSINLTGSGFGGITESVSQAVTGQTK